MMENKFTLSWDAYQKNIGKGLASLQQNGEFVDMTLAADGHFVKVHQLIVSLASPYIKELIKSAQCQHPVIFLNKISYATLCYVLEYIYTGEVVVAQKDLINLLDAGAALHIKGLKDMSVKKKLDVSQTSQVSCNIVVDKTESSDDKKEEQIENEKDLSSKTTNEFYFDHRIDSSDEETREVKENMDTETKIENDMTITNDKRNLPPILKKAIPKKAKIAKDHPVLQYTVSNQGSLQLVLNRYIYTLRYSSRKANGLRRQWRCEKYNPLRCHATVVTMDNVVVQRSRAHTHPFNDRRLLKKVREGAIFSAVAEAEQRGQSIKKTKSIEPDKNK